MNGQTALLEYRQRGNKLALTHTEVPDELEGQGIGSQLARAALEHARAGNLKVEPWCGFVSAYMRRHPEYNELLTEEWRGRLGA